MPVTISSKILLLLTPVRRVLEHNQAISVDSYNLQLTSLMISYSIIKNRTQSIIIFDFNAEMYSSLVKIQKNQSFKVHHKSMKLILGVFEGTENSKKGVKTLLWS